MNLTDTEYVAEATRLAEEELIPKFMERLAADIQISGVDLSLVKLSLFSNSVSGNSAFETSLWGGGYANGLAQVVSFDMNEPQTEGAELSMSIAATFMPSSWGHVYSSEDMLFVGGQGWDWSEDAQASGQTTYLVGFELNGATSSATITGAVPGYLLNPYSLDFHEGYLRVATTQSFFTMVMFDDMLRVAEEPAAEEATSTARHKIGVVNGQESTTENHVTVLKVPTASTENVLQQVGSVQLGKKNEVRVDRWKGFLSRMGSWCFNDLSSVCEALALTHFHVSLFALLFSSRCLRRFDSLTALPMLSPLNKATPSMSSTFPIQRPPSC